jgi:hypothetical protein
MTDEKERDAERKLAELFDRSAGALSNHDREKLLRRASDIGRVARRGPRAAVYVWLPALAAAAAVVYLVVPKRHSEPARAAVSAPSAPSRGVVAPAAPNTASERTEVGEAEDLVTSVLAGDPSEDEPLDLEPLMADTEHADNAEHGSAGRARSGEDAERSVR